jgi:hypothetical protein
MKPGYSYANTYPVCLREEMSAFITLEWIARSHLDFAVVNVAGRLVKANSAAPSVSGFTEFVKTVPSTDDLYGRGHNIVSSCVVNSGSSILLFKKY